jgi:hypothetical protein
VFTSFAAGASPEMPPPAPLQLAARVDHASAAAGGALPPFLVASAQLPAGKPAAQFATVPGGALAGTPPARRFGARRCAPLPCRLRAD